MRKQLLSQVHTIQKCMLSLYNQDTHTHTHTRVHTPGALWTSNSSKGLLVLCAKYWTMDAKGFPSVYQLHRRLSAVLLSLHLRSFSLHAFASSQQQTACHSVPGSQWEVRREFRFSWSIICLRKTLYAQASEAGFHIIPVPPYYIRQALP